MENKLLRNPIECIILHGITYNFYNKLSFSSIFGAQKNSGYAGNLNR